MSRINGWTSPLSLTKLELQMIFRVEYQRSDHQRLHSTIAFQSEVVSEDTVVICAGQLPARSLFDQFAHFGIETTLVGAAF